MEAKSSRKCSLDQKLWSGRKMTRLYIRLATKLGEPEVRHHERGMLVFSLLGCLTQLRRQCFPHSGSPLLSEAFLETS